LSKAINKIKFGPAGNSASFYAEGLKGTENTAAWLKLRGLTAFEYSFGHGINMGEAKAKAIRKAFFDCGIEISAHAPYYINFANESEEEINNSCRYLTDSIEKLITMGGKRVVFHTAAMGKETRAEVFNRTLKNLEILIKRLDEKNLNDVYVCPETMGRISQIGSLEEIIEICKMDRRFIPCIDFGHINSREKGCLNSVRDFNNIIEKLLKEIPDKAGIFHAHFSKIQYGPQGEIRHLNFDDTKYGPNPDYFIEALKNFDISPYVICESKETQGEDALYMKTLYEL